MPAADSEPPEFRDWADDPENALEADALIAQFVAEEGVEMTSELIGCRGQQHQLAAERWMGKLGERFERWWSQGRPRISTPGKVSITYWMPAMEREAQHLLMTKLPMGAAFAVTRHWRKTDDIRTQLGGWSCKIEDQLGNAMGKGETPLAAAERALAAWQEFVGIARVATLPAEEVTQRPPLLDAPSSTTSADVQEQENRHHAG
jgi:hypothetical protein